MKRLMSASFIALGCCLSTLYAAPEPQVGQTWQGQAAVRFSCTSTLHNFSGEVPCETFQCTFVVDPNSGKAAIRADIDALVQKMNTHNKKRDKNLRKMFQADRFPRIHVTVLDADAERTRPVFQTLLPDQPPREKPGTLPLLLKIREVQRPLVGQVSHLQIHADHVSFQMNFEISLKAFNLKPPSVLGLIRVGDRIRLQADVTLRPSIPEVPAAGAEATSGSERISVGSQS